MWMMSAIWKGLSTFIAWLLKQAAPRGLLFSSSFNISPFGGGQIFKVWLLRNRCNGNRDWTTVSNRVQWSINCKEHMKQVRDSFNGILRGGDGIICLWFGMKCVRGTMRQWGSAMEPCEVIHAVGITLKRQFSLTFCLKWHPYGGILGCA